MKGGTNYIQAQSGESIEVVDWWPTTSPTVVTLTLVIGNIDPGCDHACGVVGAELEIGRPEVERLRQLLTEWLSRGAP
jgi:hypothetical protein